MYIVIYWLLQDVLISCIWFIWAGLQLLIAIEEASGSRSWSHYDYLVIIFVEIAMLRLQLYVCAWLWCNRLGVAVNWSTTIFCLFRFIYLMDNWNSKKKKNETVLATDSCDPLTIYWQLGWLTRYWELGPIDRTLTIRTHLLTSDN
jgi:hypothetical protein